MLLKTICITILLITSCYTKKKRKQEKKQKNSKYRYITNWDIYKIPNPILVDDLKDILVKVALFEQKKYCPFEEKKCEGVGYSDAITQIVSDVAVKYQQLSEIATKDNTTLSTNSTANSNATKLEDTEKPIQRTFDSEKVALNETPIKNTNHRIQMALKCSKPVNNCDVSNDMKTEKMYGMYNSLKISNKRKKEKYYLFGENQCDEDEMDNVETKIISDVHASHQYSNKNYMGKNDMTITLTYSDMSKNYAKSEDNVNNPTESMLYDTLIADLRSYYKRFPKDVKILMHWLYEQNTKGNSKRNKQTQIRNQYYNRYDHHKKHHNKSAQRLKKKKLLGSFKPLQVGKNLKIKPVLGEKAPWIG